MFWVQGWAMGAEGRHWREKMSTGTGSPSAATSLTHDLGETLNKQCRRRAAWRRWVGRRKVPLGSLGFKDPTCCSAHGPSQPQLKSGLPTSPSSHLAKGRISECQGLISQLYRTESSH